MTRLRDLRRRLHAAPELSGSEFATAERIEQFLLGCSPDEIRVGIGGSGVLATFRADETGPEVLLRCELDALPIVELNQEPHASLRSGVSHKCGHDGHMAMLCGVALELAAMRPRRGVVHLLFQPAEETGTGAAAVLADESFADVQPDFAVAVHNMPGFRLGQVVVKSGPMTPAVKSLVITFVGSTAHASQPQEGRSPVLAVADLLRACVGMEVADMADEDFRLVTAVHARVGRPAYGVTAGDGEVHLTLRTRTDVGLRALEAQIRDLAVTLGTRDGLDVFVETVEEFAATLNDPAVTDLVRGAASDAGLAMVTPETGMAAGEDFGLFSARFPCCLVLLGAGEGHAPLHSPYYDFPDELIPAGVELYCAVLTRAGVLDP